MKATLILHVSDSGEMLLDDLSSKCEMSADDTQKKMKFWVSKNVVLEVTSESGQTKYVVIEDQAVFAVGDGLHGEEMMMTFENTSNVVRR
jgi:hypothetical protein